MALRPKPPRLPIAHVTLVINDSDKKTLLCAVSNPVLSSKILPSKLFRLSNRKNNPLSVVLTRKNTTIVNPEITAELKSSLNDVTTAS